MSLARANAAVVVDVATNTVLRQSPVSLAHSSCGSGDGQHAYVGSLVDLSGFSVAVLDALEIMDPATGKVGAPIPTGGSPHHTRPSVDGEYEPVGTAPAEKMPHWSPRTGSKLT